jgi:integrase
MALTHLRLEALRKNSKPGKHSDQAGLYIRVTPAGRMYWQAKLRTAKGETTLSHGVYPEVSLAEARQLHMAARASIRAGVNPNEQRKAAKAAVIEAVKHTFEQQARDWLGVRSAEWAPLYATKMTQRLEADVFPWVRDRHLEGITAAEWLTVFRRIEQRGALETAHRMRDTVGMVYRFAIACGIASNNPVRDLRAALKKPITSHRAALLDPTRLSEFLLLSGSYAGSLIVRTALQLTPLLLCRPGELRRAEWSEIDLEASTWTIPAAKMKRTKEGKLAGDPHVVPLPTQAVTLLRELSPVTAWKSQYVFPGERHRARPMSDGAVIAAMRTLGFGQDEVTAHGFRATARTLLAETLEYPDHIIEAQLAHSVRDPLGRAYNRTKFLAQRREMMQAWGDHLDELRTAARARPSAGAAKHVVQDAHAGTLRPTQASSRGSPDVISLARPKRRLVLPSQLDAR